MNISRTKQGRSASGTGSAIEVRKAPKEMTECHSWIQDQFGWSHIKHKGLSKSSGFKSKTRGANASASSDTTSPNLQLT